MTQPFTMPPPRAQWGNAQRTFSYSNVGSGYFFAPRTGTLTIQCWGKGGDGTSSLSASLGGGGGGAGGYSSIILSVTAGDVFVWNIHINGTSRVSSDFYALSMEARHGTTSGGATAGIGGAASGGTTNISGANGLKTSTQAGAVGGNAPMGGAGGSGGASGYSGHAGLSPGGGGGGSGANGHDNEGGVAPIGGAGGAPRITFTW